MSADIKFDVEAAIAAEHAIVVQGGFSTPEIEAGRIAADRARGIEPDFDKMADEIAEAKRPAAELDALVQQALVQINSGSVSLADLLKALSPKQQSAPVPAVLPKPAEIAEKERAAMARVPDVFGQVVPTERRALEPVEVKALVIEKQTLDEVKKMAARRLDDIVITVHNHLDVEIEEALEEANRPLRDEKGHYVSAGQAPAPGEDQQFTREVKNYAASLSLESLKLRENLGLLSHEDFLAMTTQIRVIDEAKIMQVLRKKPELIKDIAAATTAGKQGTSVQLRKKN